MRTALITGASSGIGEGLARRLASMGYNLFLVARTEEKLRTICEQIENEHRVSAQYASIDLSIPGAASDLYRRTEGIEIDLLVNNAGIGSRGDFVTLPLNRELQLIDLNISALVELTHLYLKPMRERRRGTILNIGSTASFQPVPYSATYAATKAFVLSFSESLWEENRFFGVRIVALCPGLTDTNFFAASGIKPTPGLSMESVEQVVESAIRAIHSNRSHMVSGWSNSTLVLLGKLIPRQLTSKIIGRTLRPHLGIIIGEGIDNGKNL
jgi:uncharacterized protein